MVSSAAQIIRTYCSADVPGRGNIVEQLLLSYSSVIDQHINAAEPLFNSIHHCFHLDTVRDAVKTGASVSPLADFFANGSITRYGGIRMSKTVLITGGSRGIGAAAAMLFAQEGYQVAVNYCANRLRAVEIATRRSETSAQKTSAS